VRFFQWLKKGGGYGTGSTIWSRGDGRGASALDHRDATLDTDALVLLPEDMEASR
jgi:hypothetical protein